MTDLFLCVDPGASQTKIIYQLQGESSTRYLLMSPDVEPICQESLDFYFASTGWLGHPTPVQQAWLHVNDGVFVVGDFASQFDPEDRLTELKYENALYKVLAAIGVIREHHDLNSKKKLAIQLALLLPASEYNDRQRFRERLAFFLSRFSFRDTLLRVKLERFLCRPEGGGLVSIAIVRNGLDWLQQRKLGVLMLGHRNVSALYFEYGSMTTLDSPLIGFSQFLDLVVALTSGLERNCLADALFAALDAAGRSIYSSNWSQDRIYYTEHPSWSSFPSIQNLAQAKDPTLRQQEMSALVSAIDNATSQYWFKLSKWLNKVFPDDLDAVIISGGASRFLQPEIEQYFNCQPFLKNSSDSHASYSQHCFDTSQHQALKSRYSFTPIIWGAGLQEIVEDTFDLTDNNQSLSYRLVDAYGLFDQLLGQNNLAASNSELSSSPQESSEEVEEVG